MGRVLERTSAKKRSVPLRCHCCWRGTCRPLRSVVTLTTPRKIHVFMWRYGRRRQPRGVPCSTQAIPGVGVSSFLLARDPFSVPPAGGAASRVSHAPCDSQGPGARGDTRHMVLCAHRDRGEPGRAGLETGAGLAPASLESIIFSPSVCNRVILVPDLLRQVAGVLSCSPRKNLLAGSGGNSHE